MNVYVIDVYDTPIERKISEYLNKLSSFHFHDKPKNMEKIINRFNKLFPYLDANDYYFDKKPFDNTIQIINNIKYIRLRMMDNNWENILSNVLNTQIVLISNDKPSDLYTTFINNYKIPINHLMSLDSNKYINYYLSEQERKDYFHLWNKKMDNNPFIHYTIKEYEFYVHLCIENQNNIEIIEDCIDNGCCCVLCTTKRTELYNKVKNGETITEKINHNDLVLQNNNKMNEKIKILIKNTKHNNNNLKKIQSFY
jgi:hypothetical protein